MSGTPFQIVNECDVHELVESLNLCTGFEPMFDPLFHSNPMIKNNNNCYAHAALALKTSTPHMHNTKMQPGNRAENLLEHVQKQSKDDCTRLRNLIGADWHAHDLQISKVTRIRFGLNKMYANMYINMCSGHKGSVKLLHGRSIHGRIFILMDI